jgi:2-methylisocitrate lyase-like PEP mutase family enzyme
MLPFPATIPEDAMPAAPSRKTFRQLVAEKRPLVIPGAHDALTARIIEQTGFDAFMIGGFQIVGARHGLPDIGLAGLGEIAAGVRDILAVTDLPCLVDVDTGYGDVKNAVHTLNTYERIGAQAIFIEDQQAPKRCGHMAGKRIVPAAEMEAKLRACAGERLDPDTFIIARTDAIATDGLDEALRRGERYMKAGADALFIEAPTSVEDMRRICETLPVPQLANMIEGGVTPLLKPAELAGIGYAIASYGITTLMLAARTIRDALADIHGGELTLANTGLTFPEYLDIVGMPRWAAVEDRYGR